MSKSSFWPSFWGAFVGFIVANLIWCIIGLIIFFALLGALAGSMSSVFEGSNKSVSVKSNSILHITLDEQILERSNNNPFQSFNFMDFEGSPLGLNQIVTSIEEAKNDDKISGIYLDISSIPTGIATLEEIRNAILDFKTSKKFVVAYSEEYAQGAYYLATAADRIYLNPQGMVDFKGLSRRVMFYKKLLDKLEVEVQVFRHGKYKSATEPFFLEKMSSDNRVQTLAYVRSIWNYIVEGISTQRHINVQELNRYADNMLITDANSASQYKLVDSLIYKDEMLNVLSGLVNEKIDKINYIKLNKYITAVSNRSRSHSKDKIAVVYASGEINGGNGDDQSIGSERISKAIREARQNEDIKAIVLRVNSPGGSALASDVIWREMVLAKKTKPVIVSMGDVAASGGYYIACAADAIVAHPNTITGSIGVFGLVPNAQKFFENKLGLTTDTVNTNKHSDIMNIYRPVSKDEGEVIQKWINNTYNDFITKVGEGRKMKPEQIDSIGQGRVWSGAEAKKIGLVDEFGGLQDAIAMAAHKAQLEQYDIMELPKMKEPLEEFINHVTGQEEVIERKLKNEFGEAYENYKQLKNIMKYRGVQMRLPYDIILY